MMSADARNPTDVLGTAAQVDKVEELLSRAEGTDYIDQVMRLYEESERNYRAAAEVGQVVYGFTDSTNY